MEDTLFKTYPNLNRISIDVQDNENIIIVLGDKEFYTGTEEKRKAVTEEISPIMWHIYEANNYLKKGSVVFVPAESPLEVPESLKKTYKIDVEALKAKDGK
jgi:hypothetical protein